MSDSEREDYDALRTHPGWQRLVAFAKQQWGGVTYRNRIDQAIAKAEDSKGDVAAAVKAVNAATDAVNQLLSHPAERVKQLEKPVVPVEPTLSRSGL